MAQHRVVDGELDDEAREVDGEGDAKVGDVGVKQVLFGDRGASGGARGEGERAFQVELCLIRRTSRAAPPEGPVQLFAASTAKLDQGCSENREVKDEAKTPAESAELGVGCWHTPRVWPCDRVFGVRLAGRHVVRPTSERGYPEYKEEGEHATASVPDNVDANQEDGRAKRPARSKSGPKRGEDRAAVRGSTKIVYEAKRSAHEKRVAHEDDEQLAKRRRALPSQGDGLTSICAVDQGSVAGATTVQAPRSCLVVQIVPNGRRQLGR